MAHTLILVPAYGRQYATEDVAKAAWDAGKDFKIVNGPYCSKRDIDTMKRLNNIVLMRYGQGHMLRL